MLRLVMIVLLVITGCSTSSSTVPLQELKAIEEVELYMSRDSLANTEFEHFKLRPPELYIACGLLLRGRSLAQMQTFITLSESSSLNILESAHKVIHAQDGMDSQLEAPGENSSLFDPGQFLLTITTTSDSKSLHTSLDSVANSKTPLEGLLLQLAKLVRTNAADQLCSPSDFFGISKEDHK